VVSLDSVKDYRVLLVGDAIMDEYVYVQTIGKAIKENALSSILHKREQFRGGVWAAAEHVKQFCKHVDVLTGDTMMWNSRLVDDIYLRKLFVTHEVRPNLEVCPQYDIGSYDLVIVCDFGHGALTKNMIKKLMREARFLAVNTQTNATNYGFNVITKYLRAEYVVLDELEARLATQDRDSSIEDVIIELGYKRVIVTRGIHGAVGFDGTMVWQEALTDRVVDTMGAGDAFFAVSAPFALAGASMKDLIEIGNAAGAVKVGIVGHRKSVDMESLRSYLDGQLEN